MSQEVERLEDERRGLFALLSALVASAGDGGITITHESLHKTYEVTRFEDPQSLTITFTAKEREE